MASDEIVWQVINGTGSFCAYKIKVTKQTFCRNTYNVTGFCNRSSCPLANSRYATIRADPESGTLYLYMKVAERSHLPSKMWERIKLSKDYSKAIEQIDSRLMYWPNYLILRCKQRLTRLTQVAIRTRRLAKEEERLGERLVPKLAPKVRRREETRERKALAAAKVEKNIEKELLDRLRSGAYGDRPLNVEEGIWSRVLRGLERQGEGVRDEDLDEGVEEELEEELEEEGLNDVEYVEGEDESDIDDLEDWLGESGEEQHANDAIETEESDSGTEKSASDDDKSSDKKRASGGKRKRPGPPAKPTKKRPRVEIEYEQEIVAPQREAIRA